MRLVTQFLIKGKHVRYHTSCFMFVGSDKFAILTVEREIIVVDQ
jgi:hypothetical protein